MKTYIAGCKKAILAYKHLTVHTFNYTLDFI